MSIENLTFLSNIKTVYRHHRLIQNPRNMELFMTLVKGTKPLTNFTKSSILAAARIPCMPLVTALKFFLTPKFLITQS